MIRSVRVLLAVFFSLAGAMDIYAQRSQPVQRASLHPAVNSLGNNVTEPRASDGANLGTREI